MTLRVAGVAFVVSLVVSVWAIIVTPVGISVQNIWKFGLLYGIMFLIWLLERGARKEEAEERLKIDVPLAEARGVEIGQRATWHDRLQHSRVSRQLSARADATTALLRLTEHSPEALAIIAAMEEKVALAEQDALLDVARMIEQSGILPPRGPT